MALTLPQASFTIQRTDLHELSRFRYTAGNCFFDSLHALGVDEYATCSAEIRVRLVTYLDIQWSAHAHCADVDMPAWLHSICVCILSYATENGLHGSRNEVIAAYIQRMSLFFTRDPARALQGDAVMQAIAARYYDINLVVCTPIQTVRGVHVRYGEVVRYNGDGFVRARQTRYLGWQQMGTSGHFWPLLQGVRQHRHASTNAFVPHVLRHPMAGVARAAPVHATTSCRSGATPVRLASSCSGSVAMNTNYRRTECNNGAYIS
jgi:hypothetical protein